MEQQGVSSHSFHFAGRHATAAAACRFRIAFRTHTPVAPTHVSGERGILQRLIAGPVSGDALAQEAGLTRAAMWKRIEALREAGVEIDAQAGRGYSFTVVPEQMPKNPIYFPVERVACTPLGCQRLLIESGLLLADPGKPREVAGVA